MSPIIGFILRWIYNSVFKKNASIERFISVSMLFSTVLFVGLVISGYNMEKKPIKGYDILCEQECVNVFSSSNKDLVVFRYTDNCLTHSEGLHKYNLKEGNVESENIMWTPKFQEQKTSQYKSFDQVYRYNQKIKKKMVEEFCNIHEKYLSWCEVRYIF